VRATQLAVRIRPVRPPATRHRAFTLIELLVVIAIIAILVGLLFPAFKAVQTQARQTQAKNDLTQIVNAVNAFYTDYGKYPINVPLGNTNDAYVGTGGSIPAGATSYGTNNVLFDELRAVTNTLNTRQIVFISPPFVKDGNNPRSGIGTTTLTGQYFDPWGKTYSVAIDTSYDNQISNPYTANTGAGPTPLRQGVIAWSLGNDGIQGMNFSNSDDVISWQ